MGELLQDVGMRIRERRKALGYTQEQVAEMIDVSIQMISNLERGNKSIKIDNLLKISKALDVSTDYILTGSCSNDEISSKMARLSERDFRLVCNMIDACLQRK